MPKESKNSKEKKHFFKDFKAELKKVIWPTPKQLINNTVAVVTIVLITAAIVFVLDITFEKMNTYGIGKLKELVGTNEITNETLENEQSANNNDNAEETNQEANSSENITE